MLHRTIIVPKAKQALSQSLCAGLAGNAGAGMFVVGLSATGNAPATHFISSGPISDQPPFEAMARLGLQIVQVPLP